MQGTILFMSCSVLKSHERRFDCVPNHDQLDDLESFYLVLYDLMCSWAGVGVQVRERPQDLVLWDKYPDNPLKCVNMKLSHFVRPQMPNMKPIPPFWLPATRQLLVGFYQVVRGIIMEKLPFHPLTSEEQTRALKAFVSTADAAYDKVLDMFDKALRELAIDEAVDDEPQILVHQPVSAPNPPSPPHRQSLRKRAAPDDFDEAPQGRRRPRQRIQPTFSPPRTRAAVKAALKAQENSNDARRTEFSPRRTRAAVRAAKLKGHANHVMTTPGVHSSSRRSKTSKSIAKARNVPGKGQDPSMTRQTRSSARAAALLGAESAVN